MVKAKVWVIGTKCHGMPKIEDFKCIEEELPECQDGDIIIEAESWSVDPYMRYRIRGASVNDVVFGSQVAKVIESKNKSFPVGCYVVGYPGWRTHSRLTKAELEATEGFSCMKLPDMGNFPKSYSLGVTGMPGNTAYFGFLEICRPESGDTVVVNAAAGAVGSLVCQIAKIKGCRVIGFAGSDTKVEWLKELGVDHAFNYKTVSVFDTLKDIAPNGVNCYFDNVGGQFTSEVLPHMADFGRISICGCISTYNDESRSVTVPDMKSPFSEAKLLWKQLKVEGFIVTRWLNRWMEGIGQIQTWLSEGKLKYKETTTQGFENMPKAFMGLFTGDNIGKAIVTR